MSLFKEIIDCLEKGGSVYESTTDFHVIAYLRSGGKNCLYLGVDKSVFLEIPAHDVESSSLCFSLFDKEEDKMINEIKRMLEAGEVVELECIDLSKFLTEELNCKTRYNKKCMAEFNSLVDEASDAGVIMKDGLFIDEEELRYFKIKEYSYKPKKRSLKISNVEIKFWNSEKKEYETEDWLILNSDGSVSKLGDYGLSNGLALYGVGDCIVPHFFKDGKRIA